MAGGLSSLGGFLQGFLPPIEKRITQQIDQENALKAEQRQIKLKSYFAAAATPGVSPETLESLQKEMKPLFPSKQAYETFLKANALTQKISQAQQGQQGQQQPSVGQNVMSGSPGSMKPTGTGQTPQPQQQQPSQGPGAQALPPPPQSATPAQQVSQAQDQRAQQAADAKRQATLQDQEARDAARVKLADDLKNKDRDASKVEVSPEVVKSRLPGLMPDADGKFRLTPDLAKIAMSPEPIHVIPSTGGTIVDAHGKILTTVKPEEKPETPTAAMKEEMAYQSTHGVSDPEEAKKKAAETLHQARETREKGAEDRNKATEKKLGVPSPPSKSGGTGIAPPIVSPGTGKPTTASKYNPSGDLNIELQAWEYINGQHVTVTGGSGRGGKEAYEHNLKVTGRAAEILRDLGLTPAELPVIRGQLKAESGALAKVTSMGALVQQFEGTVEKNMTTAEKLSKEFDRTPNPWVNRLAAAWNTGTGGSEANNFVGQMHALAAEWAKVMQGATSAGGAHVQSTQDAERIMSPYLAKGAVSDLFQKVIIPDMTNRTESINEEKERIVQKIRGAVPNNGQTPGSRAVGSPGPDPFAALPKAPASGSKQASDQVIQQYVKAAGGDVKIATQKLKDRGWQ